MQTLFCPFVRFFRIIFCPYPARARAQGPGAFRLIPPRPPARSVAYMERARAHTTPRIGRSSSFLPLSCPSDRPRFAKLTVGQGPSGHPSRRIRPPHTPYVYQTHLSTPASPCPCHALRARFCLPFRRSNTVFSSFLIQFFFFEKFPPGKRWGLGGWARQPGALIRGKSAHTRGGGKVGLTYAGGIRPPYTPSTMGTPHGPHH